MQFTFKDPLEEGFAGLGSQVGVVALVLDVERLARLQGVDLVDRAGRMLGMVLSDPLPGPSLGTLPAQPAHGKSRIPLSRCRRSH